MSGVAQSRIFFRWPNVVMAHNVVVDISRGDGITVWHNVWVPGNLCGVKSDGKTS